MADAVVGAIIQPLVEKLITLAGEQASLVKHFEDDLKTLQTSFSIVQGFLHDAEKKKVTEEKVKSWLRELEDLAFDADNVIDDIHYKLLSKKVKRSLNKKVQSLFSSPISYRQKMGRRIKEINERLEKIRQLATDFGLQESLAGAPDRLDAYDENREENAFAKDPIFLGRENEVSEIVNMLITTSPDGQNSSVVLPIVGMGGQGKTTIAREVYDDEKIKSHFGDNRVWVYVSGNFDVLNILKKVLTSITTKKSDLETHQDILKELQEHLGAKKYLLVLDDVWNKNKVVWDGFFNSLLGISSANGFSMIVTTRIEDVASIVKTHRVHKLQGLSEDDCWSIIKANAFKGENVPVDFEEIGKNIAKKCQGLPLAAKVVGGLLSGMESKDEWKSIEENWLSYDENSISNVLKLSFDHLPSQSLKKCFAYCSIFPKGYEIERQQLVELWMAEGFLQTDHQRSNTSMDVTGTKFFNLLLHNSLLQVVWRDRNDNVTHCNMHDLVHDLACSVLCEKGNCKRRYIGYEPSGDGLSSIPEGQERYVRTLFCEAPNIKFFDDFKSLHTLTLVGYDIDDLPTSIKKLKHLRYLDISETCIGSLPDWIGELYHLQTLRLPKKENMFVRESRIYILEKLPDSLSFLISLRHLHISDQTTLPPKVGKLASLQTLLYFNVGDEKGCRISELGPLKNLKGELQIRNLGKVRDQNEAMGADLIGKTGIYKLKLVWYGYLECEAYEANVHESVLEGLQPQPNLERLEIFEFKGNKFPMCWERLKNLTVIKLTYCSECEELPMLGQLRNLKYLKLKGLTNLKCLPDGLFSNNHNLSKMKISFCPEITHIVPFLRGGGAPSLRMLRIYDCSSLRELHSLNSLETLNIWKCPDLKSIPYPSSRGGGYESQQQQGFTSLRELYIRDCKGLTDLSIEMLESCALSLESLTLEELSSLTNISEVIGCFDKMTRLTNILIWSVPKLSIQSHLKRLTMGPPTSKFNKDSSCNNVSFNQTFDLLQPSQIFTSRCDLELRGMDHWDCLPDRLQHLTSLEKLNLYGSGIETLPEWFGNLSSLETLTLHSCKKLRHLPSKQAMQRLSKLTTLQILSCPLLEKEKGSDNIDDSNSEGPQIVDSEWSKISHIPIVKVD